jgi:hypothetical protein
LANDLDAAYPQDDDARVKRAAALIVIGLSLVLLGARGIPVTKGA